MNAQEQEGFLRLVASVLIRCVILSVAVMLLWSGAVVIAGDFAYGVHAGMFDITRHEFDLLNYYGIALTKLFAFTFFFLPYISILLVLKKRSAGAS